MISILGTAITIDQGDTLDIDAPITDANGVPVSLVGAKTRFSFCPKGGTVSRKTCTVLASTVTASFTEEETLLMSGIYDYEMRVKNAAGKTLKNTSGIIKVNPILDPVVMS